MLADTFEHAGLTVKIDHDVDCTSPREYDNLTVIYGDHRHYEIGDGKPPAQHREALERGGVRLLERYLRLCEGAVAFSLVGMIDHSGVHLYLGGGAHWSDSAGWDSGTVGYIYITRARLYELCGEAPEFAEPGWLAEAMKDELAEYDRWASGECYGFVVEDARGNHLNSCWGFIGREYAEEGAKQAAEACARERLERIAKVVA